jgi:hypothetical protein
MLKFLIYHENFAYSERIVVPEDTYSERIVMSKKLNTGYKINTGEEWHTNSFIGVITFYFSFMFTQDLIPNLLDQI